MPEPSVLDFIKEILTPWRKRTIFLSQLEDKTNAIEGKSEEPIDVVEDLPANEIPTSKRGTNLFDWPWQVFLAILSALVGQRALEPPTQHVAAALIFYCLAVLLLVWGLIQKRWNIPVRMSEAAIWRDAPVKWRRVFLSVPFMVLAFLLFGHNRFTFLNLFIWVLSIVLLVSGFWIHSTEPGTSIFRKIADFLKNPTINLRITPVFWVFIVLVIIAIFFRFGNLSQIPGEMFSDHAEKLLDVGEVLQGQYSIFFPRNTGREAIQMYLTAAVSIIFGTGLSFMSLKLGTALAGIFALPFIYLLAKEIGGRRLGLLAFFLAAVAYWPNVISRVGLRFPLYPLFVAPLLYFIIKGFKTGSRNQFILAGIALGLGLHGYSPMRIVPVVVVLLFGLYLLFPSARGKRQQVILGLIILALVSFAVFIPLLRYAVDDPQMFAFRALTRISTVEQEFPAPASQVFLQNLWKSMIMFFWNNGNIWVHSVTNRPALDVVSAVFLFFGMGFTAWRAIRQRSWVDAILLVSIPLFMLPSILSLAFPDENPSLNRSGGAIIPVFITAAIGMDALFSALIKGMKNQAGKILGFGMISIILILGATQNYDLIFRQFKNQFNGGAWNTSQLGSVIRDFAESTGTYDTAYVVPYPHWVDTRLVGINAGQPTKDYALWPENFPDTLAEPRAKMFLLKADDNTDLEELLKYYPDASVYLYDQALEGKDFNIVYVPPMR